MAMVDFKKICRACNNEKSNLLNFYSNDEDETTLGEMYSSVTLLVLNELDGLPQHICYPCAKKLEAAFSFQKSCQKNEKQLKKICEKIQKYKGKVPIQRNENINVEEINIEKPANNETLPNKIVTKQESSDNIPPDDFHLNIPPKDTKSYDINNTTTATTIQHLPEVEHIYTWGDEELNEPLKKIQRLTTITETDSNIQPIICDQCDKRFFTSAALILHQKLHKRIKKIIVEPEKSSSRKMFQCKFCKKTFIELVYLKNHIFECHAKELTSNKNSLDGKVTKLIIKK